MTSDRIVEVPVNDNPQNEQENTEVVKVEVTDNPPVPEITGEEKQKKKKVPRRVLHFSDGVLEEYSTDEEQDEPDKVKRETVNEVTAVNPKMLTWGPWFWYQTVFLGSKTLEVCDYFGESLAKFFGITTPKYQYEMDYYQSIKAEEEEQKKQQDLEMGGWVNTEETNGEAKKEGPDQPVTVERY